MTRIWNDQSGFGTLEALIAFFILAMMLGGAVQLVSGSSALLKRGKTLADERRRIDRFVSQDLPSVLKKARPASRSGSDPGFSVQLETISDAGLGRSPATSGRLIAVRIRSAERSSQEGGALSGDYLTFRFVGSQDDE